MSGGKRQRKPGTTRGSPRRSRTAKAACISRPAVKSRCAPEWGGWGRVSLDAPGHYNPARSEGPWGGGPLNPPRRHTKESSARHSAGQPIRTPQCAQDGGKPGVKWRMPGAGLSQRCTGKAPSDTPAFQPYRGNPAVRKRVQQKLVCSVGGRPTEVTVRSLVAWIPGRRESRIPEAYRPSHPRDGERVIGP